MEPHPNKGILYQPNSKPKYKLARYSPSPDLSHFIKRYWIVTWDLRGRAPYEQVILSHPNVNLVIEKGNSKVYGVSKMTSSHLLQGQGKVLGVKFQPGGFYPFWKAAISDLTEKSVRFQDAFGISCEALEQEWLELEDEDGMIAGIERFFRSCLPERDEQAEFVREVVDSIAEDRELMRVDDLVHRFGIAKRTLQRLFNRYVGVSPKWVIQRYRLHEAAAQMEQGSAPDWSQLSTELGYFDQSHFIKDFQSIVGCSPEEYVRAVQRAD